jgi:hypothetical protein
MYVNYACVYVNVMRNIYIINIYINTHTHTYIYTCIPENIFICEHIHTRIHTYIYGTRRAQKKRISAQKNIFLQTCIHACIHAHISFRVERSSGGNAHVHTYIHTSYSARPNQTDTGAEEYFGRELCPLKIALL